MDPRISSSVATNVNEGTETLRSYWWYRPHESFPPPAIKDTSDFVGGYRLNVVCTQTDLRPSQQKRLIEQWCRLLPTLTEVKTLWLSSKVSQELFDAACSVPGLEGLYIKWSSIKNLESLDNASSLRFLHLGSSPQIESISTLSRMKQLEWLELENLKRISDLAPLSDLRGLVGLAVDGSTWSTQRVESLKPLSSLVELRYLSLVNLKAKDKSLRPLHSLSRLSRLFTAKWWPVEEMTNLYDALPRLHRESDAAWIARMPHQPKP